MICEFQRHNVVAVFPFSESSWMCPLSFCLCTVAICHVCLVRRYSPDLACVFPSTDCLKISVARCNNSPWPSYIKLRLCLLWNWWMMTLNVVLSFLRIVSPLCVVIKIDVYSCFSSIFAHIVNKLLACLFMRVDELNIKRTYQ